jgi:hypothetical protein
MFSTKNFLYVIDRNGNFVENYPVRLRAPATCGMALFDYDDNLNYRILIACSDHRVYAYDKEGSLVPGWNITATESDVTIPVRHFRIDDKDYLVFGDRMKTYILDRKGNTRTDPGTYFEKPLSASYSAQTEGPGGPGIVTTDINGKIYFMYFNGKVNSVETGTFTKDHYFEYHDLNGDGTGEFIFLDKNKLSVFGQNKKILFEKAFTDTITERPVVYEFSATDRKIGVVAGTNNMIYLINNDGNVYKGFPLQGNTMFTIGYLAGNSNSFNLIVGSRDNLLFNYQLK